MVHLCVPSFHITILTFKHSKMVVLCLWTAELSTCTVLNRVFSATYLIFLSLFNRNLPSILMANTLKLLSDLMSMIDKTVSYRMVLPTFLLVSVFVATWARMSFIASEASASFFPSILSRRRILTWK